MDARIGPKGKDYLSSQAFEKLDMLCKTAALCECDARTTMGSHAGVLRVRTLLEEELNDARVRYTWPQTWGSDEVVLCQRV